jgi:hypothetical protein
MPKRKSVPLPNYPAILLDGPIKPEAMRECIAALATHYRVESPFGATSSPMKFFPVADEEISRDEALKRWADIAICLLTDFVPAFRGKRTGGAPLRTQVDPDYPYSHEAWLVEMVKTLRRLLSKKGAPSTNQAAFQLLLRYLRTKPAPKWRYGRMTKVSTLTQAWKNIPREVKTSPGVYLPPPPTPSAGAADGTGFNFKLAEQACATPSSSFDSFLTISDFLNGRTPAHPIWRILPPIPSELPKTR